MSEISFEEDQQITSRQAMPMNAQSYSARVLLSTGIVSTEKEANYLLLGIAVILLLAAGLFFSVGTSPGTGVAPLTPQSPNWPHPASARP